MSEPKNGSVDSSQTVKAGCGIRYDPDVLTEDSGFDFSNAEHLKPQQNDSDEMQEKGDKD